MRAASDSNSPGVAILGDHVIRGRSRLGDGSRNGAGGKLGLAHENDIAKLESSTVEASKVTESEGGSRTKVLWNRQTVSNRNVQSAARSETASCESLASLDSHRLPELDGLTIKSGLSRSTGDGNHSVAVEHN